MNRKIKLTQDLIDIRAFAEANNENTRKRFNTSDVGSGNAPAGCLISRASSEGSSELWDFLEIEGGKG